MPGYVENTVKDIDDRIGELKDEVARLEAARAALTGASRRRGRPAGNGATPTPARSTGRRNGRSSTPRGRGGNTRAIQALEIVRQRPGITIPELAEAMKIQPNYLYRVLPGLAKAGEVSREGQGWHAGESSSPPPVTSAPRSTRRRRTRAAKPDAKTPAATRRSRRNGQAKTVTRARTAPGTTRTSVLAAFSDGEVLTAGQIAEKTGLGRNTVATTLSRLAKRGELQKAQRGYRTATGNGTGAAAPAEAAAAK
jgi:DNA-binding IscR family transcriptional regulator